MRPEISALAAGFGTGMSLIVAIGAQNAYLLRQGIRREHVPAIVAICAGSDVLLITLGIAGVGAVVREWPRMLTAAAWIGAAFLICYGLAAARRALRPGRLDPGKGGPHGLRAAVLVCLAVTWLNPQVYLDTMLLLGSLANTYGAARWLFGLGAVAGSVLWFSAVGFGARVLAPLFARPAAWRALDGVIAVTMVAIGVRVAGIA
jgi:L-lysine exporter family protein LysE/ArgO